MTATLPPLSAADLSDLKAKAKAATPGEWEAVTRDDPRGQPVPYYQSLICTVEHSPDKHLSIVAKNGHRISREEWEANNDYIAAANPETILRLIGMIERLDAWRPIETAPKDGRFILLHVPHGLESGAVTVGAYWKEDYRKAGRFIKGHWDGWLGMDADIASSWCEPIHWQPLPAPPSEALAETEPANDKR